MDKWETETARIGSIEYETLLDEGWEPYAVTIGMNYEVNVYFKRKIVDRQQGFWTRYHEDIRQRA